MERANVRGNMSAEHDHELTPDQWETLKGLRAPACERRIVNRFIVDQLIGLELAEIVDGTPVLTRAGRKVLVRGSSRLLDLAA
jgi:hypothetical protein